MLTVDFSRLETAPGSFILDIGCGEGRHTIKAGQHRGTFCVGADFGFDALIQTKEKIKFHQALNDTACKGFGLSCMDVTRLPFQSSSFDTVICSEVLEHIKDDQKAISELVRILKPGKVMAVSVPRFWPEKICWMLSDKYRNTDGGHVRIYQKEHLTERIEAFGLKKIGMHYAHSLHSPFWWLKCLVGPDKTDSKPVNLYHQLLVWDLMKQPKVTQMIDRLLNPLLGKSVVLYFRKK